MAKIEDDTEEGESGGKPSGKTIALIVGGLVLVAALGVGAYLVLGKKQPEAPAETQQAEAAAHGAGKPGEPGQPVPGAPIYYDLPDFLVNLNTGGKQASFLKMKITLELQGDKAADNLRLIEPKIVDGFQTYLRELRASDLQGSAGMYRLKEELLLRVNKMAQPKVKVNDILFKEMIVQ